MFTAGRIMKPKAISSDRAWLIATAVIIVIWMIFTRSNPLM
ncbi:MAG: hypothetical protein ACXW12_13345 [Burkholderiales bacterium]